MASLVKHKFVYLLRIKVISKIQIGIIFFEFHFHNLWNMNLWIRVHEVHIDLKLLNNIENSVSLKICMLINKGTWEKNINPEIAFYYRNHVQIRISFMKIEMVIFESNIE